MGSIGARNKDSGAAFRLWQGNRLVYVGELAMSQRVTGPTLSQAEIKRMQGLYLRRVQGQYPRRFTGIIMVARGKKFRYLNDHT